MVEIKITENEAQNEYLIEPYQAFLGARYDNLSDEIKVIFPQKEIDNESSCTMIITNGDEPIDCVTVYNGEVFKLKSPATQYKQVFIGFSFQKADGYIKNTNIGLFFFRGAQSPDAIVPTTPIQREKINLLLADGFASVDWAQDDESVVEFKNVDRKVVKRIDIKGAQGEKGEKGDKGDKGEDGENGTKWYVCSYTFDVGTKEAAKGMMTAVGMGDIAVGDFFYCINGNIYQVTSIDESNLYFSYKFCIKGEQGAKGVDGTKWYKYNYSFDTSTTSISKGMTDSLCSYDIVIGDYFFDNNGNVFEVTGLNGNQYTVAYKICLKGYVLTPTDKADIANEVLSLIPLYNGEVTLDD